MKWSIGQVNFSLDIPQLIGGKGISLHVNGEHEGYGFAFELSYLPGAMEPLYIVLKTKKVENEN